VQTDSELSELIMRAFILRRVELIARGFGNVVLVGSNHCAGTLRVKEFLTRNGHPYSYIDLDRDGDVQDLLDRFHVSAADVPVQTDSELSELIMRAFILRRVELIARGFGNVVLVGSNHCAGTLRVKEFLTRNGHPYSYIDLDRDGDVQDLLDRFHVSAADVPVLICRGEV